MRGRCDLILEAENDSANRYKLSKQADVLMLFYLFSSEELRELFGRLGYPFEHATIPRNIAYYTSRASHGSTLSRVVYSWVLARSDRPRAMEFLAQALQSDISDIQRGTTAEGIHLPWRERSISCSASSSNRGVANADAQATAATATTKGV